MNRNHFHSREKRHYPRGIFQGQVAVDLILENKWDHQLQVKPISLIVQGADISENGMRLKLSAVPAEAKFLRVVFKINQFHHIRVSGELVWKNERFLGFRFTDLDEGDADWIRYYLDRQQVAAG